MLMACQKREFCKRILPSANLRQTLGGSKDLGEVEDKRDRRTNQRHELGCLAGQKHPSLSRDTRLSDSCCHLMARIWHRLSVRLKVLSRCPVWSPPQPGRQTQSGILAPQASLLVPGQAFCFCGIVSLLAPSWLAR